MPLAPSSAPNEGVGAAVLEAIAAWRCCELLVSAFTYSNLVGAAGGGTTGGALFLPPMHIVVSPMLLA
jgi:hypothetical protein